MLRSDPCMCARRFERSQSSTMTALMENPIQNANPKNCLGPRWVAALVAKKTPMTGRVVAIPSRIPTARVIQSRPTVVLRYQ